MVAAIWIKAIAFLFVVGIIYIVFGTLYSETRINTENLTQIQEAQDTLNWLDIIWKYWPLFLIFGVLLWAFLASQRREPGWDYYPA